VQAYLWIAIGSALGGMARFWLSGVSARLFGEALPWGTLLVNVTGSLIIGFFATFSGPGGRLDVDPAVRLFVMVGLCGGYTTFSAFSLQTLDLLRSGSVVRAAVNVAASVCLCILAVALGYWIASRWNGGQPRSAHMTIDEEAMPALHLGLVATADLPDAQDHAAEFGHAPERGKFLRRVSRFAADAAGDR